MMNPESTRKSIEQRHGLDWTLAADSGNKGGTGGGPIGTGPGSQGTYGQSGSTYGKGEGASADNVGEEVEDIGGNSADAARGQSGEKPPAGKGGTTTANPSTMGTETIDTSEPDSGPNRSKS